MTNGGYKIIDLEGLELIRNKSNPNTDFFEKIERAEKNGKPILLTNVKFKTEGDEYDYIEITIPLFIQIVKDVNVVTPSNSSYIFILPNGITGTITNTSITVS